jgi:glycosyltransferase involved in cell wall biosynthesis
VSPPDLVLLTTEYPFGSASEPFLETELPIVAERFRRVYVLPSTSHHTARQLPANAELVTMPWISGPSALDRIRAIRSARVARVLRRSLGDLPDVMRHPRSVRMYADVLTRNVLKARELEAFVRARGLEHAVYYDYWFENSTLALAICRAAASIRTAVARAHNFDIYGDFTHGWAVPFPTAKALGLDAVFPISSDGEQHLAAHVPALRGKLCVSRLGVRDPGRVSPPRQAEAVPLVVTCAQLVPEKRIDLVPEVLSLVGIPIRWVHLGDGPERPRVEREARRLLPGESWQLWGQRENTQVLRFYEEHSVGLLLSVSRSEGLPVSMMEAQSFGVPVVACDVGGVSEIVGAETGILLASDAAPAEIAAAIRRTLTSGLFDATAIRTCWRQRYEAETNYGSFANTLLALHSHNGTASQSRGTAPANRPM